MDIIFIAQLFGIISLIFNIISTQKNSKDKIFLYNGLANVACIIQYLLLGAITGAISYVIATLRNVVFSRYKNNIPLYVLIIYLLIAISLNMVAVKNIYDILPIFNICLYGIGIYQKDLKTFKILIIIVGMAGFAYDAINMAYGSMISQLLTSVAGFIGLVRYLKYKKAN